jgi:hypothetical protein
MLKKYILKEYGSWGVMTLSYLTGLFVSGKFDLKVTAAFIAFSLYINSKQAIILWLSRSSSDSVKPLIAFIIQVFVASVLLLSIMEKSLVQLLPYSSVPLVYLLFLRYLGEHSIFSEVAGFFLLALPALIVKLVASGLLDPVLYIAVAVFFTAGVFKVRTQLKKRMLDRIFMAVYLLFALSVYNVMAIPFVVLIPLLDNLFFSLTLYRVRLSATGWIEVLKGVLFVFLMTYNYY